MTVLNEIAAKCSDLDCVHEVVVGLLDSLTAVTVGKHDSRVMAITCAMSHYLDELAGVIAKVQALAAGEGA